MEEILKPKTSKHALNFGILLGVVSVAFSAILYTLNMQFEGGWLVTIISIAFTTVILALAMAQFKKENQGWLSLSEALKLGLGAALIGGIIAAVYQVVLTQVIDPEYMNKLADFQYQKLIESNPEMTQEQLDMSINMMKKFSSPYIVFPVTIVMSLFLGFIISMILGLFMKKQPAQN